MSKRWEEIIYRIEEKFGIKDKKKERFLVSEDSFGKKVFGEKEIVEFETPKGKMKIERIIQPRIIGKKVIRARRAGSRVAVNYIYSEDETVEKLKFYRWNGKEGNWEEINLENL